MWGGWDEGGTGCWVVPTAAAFVQNLTWRSLPHPVVVERAMREGREWGEGAVDRGLGWVVVSTLR